MNRPRPENNDDTKKIIKEFFQVLDTIRLEQIKIYKKLNNIEKFLKNNEGTIPIIKKVKIDSDSDTDINYNYTNLSDLCLGC